MDLIQKIKYAIENVKTKLSYCQDDDFLSKSIQKIILELSKHKNFIAAKGLCYTQKFYFPLPQLLDLNMRR